jgi:hypothetical protein
MKLLEKKSISGNVRWKGFERGLRLMRHVVPEVGVLAVLAGLAGLVKHVMLGVGVPAGLVGHVVPEVVVPMQVIDLIHFVIELLLV